MENEALEGADAGIFDAVVEAKRRVEETGEEEADGILEQRKKRLAKAIEDKVTSLRDNDLKKKFDLTPEEQRQLAPYLMEYERTKNLIKMSENKAREQAAKALGKEHAQEFQARVAEKKREEKERLGDPNEGVKNYLKGLERQREQIRARGQIDVQ